MAATTTTPRVSVVEDTSHIRTAREDSIRLATQFSKTRFYVQEMKTDPRKTTGDNKENETSVLSLPFPRNVDAELMFMKELLPKRKFNYLEQETKEKFLTAVLADPLVFYDAEDNQKLESANAIQKFEVKASKSEYEQLKEETALVVDSVCSEHERVTASFSEAMACIEDIKRMEEELAAIEASESEHTKMQLTIDESQKVLDEQTAALQNLNTVLVSLQSANADTRWRVAVLTEEIEKTLTPERQSLEMQASKAEQTAKTRDPKAAELCRWYAGAIQGMQNVLGIGSDEDCGEYTEAINEYEEEGMENLRFVFRDVEREKADRCDFSLWKRTDAKTPESNMEAWGVGTTIIVVKVTVANVKIAHAKVFGVGSDVPIADIIAHSQRQDDVCFLLQEVMWRIRVGGGQDHL